METSKRYDYMYKILAVGAANVGKTSIIARCVGKPFEESTASTVGVDFRTVTMDCYDKKVNLQLWDTAGQERYQAVTKAYYRGTTGVVLVFDITRKPTFHALEKNLVDIAECCPPTDGAGAVVMMCVGNKQDLDNEREVSTKEAAAFCKKRGMMYMETSAKTNHMISDAFQRLCKAIMDQHLSANSGVVYAHSEGDTPLSDIESIDLSTPVPTTPQQPHQKSGCDC